MVYKPLMNCVPLSMDHHALVGSHLAVRNVKQFSTSSQLLGAIGLVFYGFVDVCRGWTPFPTAVKYVDMLLECKGEGFAPWWDACAY